MIRYPLTSFELRVVGWTRGVITAVSLLTILLFGTIAVATL